LKKRRTAGAPPVFAVRRCCDIARGVRGDGPFEEHRVDLTLEPVRRGAVEQLLDRVESRAFPRSQQRLKRDRLPAVGVDDRLKRVVYPLTDVRPGIEELFSLGKADDHVPMVTMMG
jgi:hypothetical protein